MLVFDRGYQDFNGWLELTRDKVLFVTRLRTTPNTGSFKSGQSPTVPT